jgi:spermidine/putrescine ABC transporter ATP-binding subunit
VAEVDVERVTRAFGPTKAVDDLSIRFEAGKFHALLGPSGSGKTTLLRLIAGFEYPDRGRISIGRKPVEHLPTERRDIGMVFQSYALFPHLSVFDNVAFGLAVRHTPRREIRDRVGRVLELVQLAGYERRKPHQLSGGQRQRVALARAIVTRPRVLLLDEPLSALDKALRAEMQLELKRIQRDVAITTIFVTHDQEEALTLSDTIGILKDGRLIQHGQPQDVYARPSCVFAARFLGDANILPGHVRGSAVELDGQGARAVPASALPADGTAVFCAVRPERIALAPAVPGAAGGNALDGVVRELVFAGNSVTYLIETKGGMLKVFAQNLGRRPLEIGALTRLSWSEADCLILAA